MPHIKCVKNNGKPDFLKRFREKFKNGEIDFDGITCYLNIVETKKHRKPLKILGKMMFFLVTN